MGNNWQSKLQAKLNPPPAAAPVAAPIISAPAPIPSPTILPIPRPVCNAACQREKKVSELRQIYSQKKDNIVTAPVQLQEARKNYLEYTDGVDKYITKRSGELRNDATKWKQNTLSNWNQKISSMNKLVTTYEYSYDSLKQLYDFYTRISTSNNALEREYGVDESVNSTNDRRAFYEMQGTENLEWWYMFMKWLYILLVIVFIVASFLTPTNYSWKSLVTILALLIAYPIFISSIAVSSFAGIRGVLSMLPYNTYTRSLGVSFPDPNIQANMNPSPSYIVPPLTTTLVPDA